MSNTLISDVKASDSAILQPIPVVLSALLFLIAGQLQIASADEAGMLWHVQGKTNSVYLLGSVHMLRESDFPLPGEVESAYKDAEALIMELDMDDLNPLAMQRLFFERGSLPADTTLADVLGAEKWRQASDAASKVGIDLAMLSRVKPWWAAITIVQLQLAKLGFNPALGLEGHFMRKATDDKKPIEGLETAEFQIGLFDSMKLERQIDLLEKSLEDAAILEQEMEKLLSAWRRGETGELERLQRKSFADFPALYATLIEQRNSNWVQELASLLDDERDYLVVVGALHLVGENGVPAGLAREGYAVSRR